MEENRFTNNIFDGYVEGKRFGLYLTIENGQIISAVPILPGKHVKGVSIDNVINIGELDRFTASRFTESGVYEIPLTPEQRMYFEGLSTIIPITPRDISPEYIVFWQTPNSRLKRVMRKEGRRTGDHNNDKTLWGLPKHSRYLSVCLEKTSYHLRRCRGKVERTIKHLLGNQ